MELKRSGKPLPRAKETAKPQKKSQNVRKSVQPNGLLFLNVSDPAESRRHDSRKAVRSFVMKKYKQSQKPAGSVHLEQMQVDEDTNDVAEESLEEGDILGSTEEVARNADKSAELDHSHDVEELPLIPTQHSFPWPTLAHTGQSNSPISILGSGAVDPFDSYPVQINMRAHELVDLYINTEGVFPETHDFNRDRRRKVWFPLICTSKANFHGLLMSASMACSIRKMSKFESLILPNYQSCVESLHKEIKADQDLPNADSTIFTIKTLLLVAMHQGDTNAVRTHFQGAVAVVQKFGSPYRMGRLAQKIIASYVCWTSFAPPDTVLVPFAELVWSSSLYSSNEDELAEDSRNGSSYSAIINASPIQHNRNNTVGVSPRQDSPYTLSPTLRMAMAHITALSHLARRARHSELSYQELAELMAGICCGGRRLASLKPQSLTVLEDCIRMTTLVHYFADIVPFEEGDEPPIAHLIGGVQVQLSVINLEVLLREWPQVMLWIAIVVGIFAKAETWMFFQGVLRLTCGHLNILTWSGVVNVINEFQPISSEPFLGCCEAFWLSSRTLKSVILEGGKIRRHVHTTEGLG